MKKITNQQMIAVCSAIENVFPDTWNKAVFEKRGNHYYIIVDSSETFYGTKIEQPSTESFLVDSFYCLDLYFQQYGNKSPYYELHKTVKKYVPVEYTITAKRKILLAEAENKQDLLLC